jgi:hypothetical protein
MTLAVLMTLAGLTLAGLTPAGCVLMILDFLARPGDDRLMVMGSLFEQPV